MGTWEVTKNNNTVHNQPITREVTKKDTLHNQPTTKEVTKDNNTLHNQPITREVTKKDTVHNQLTTREVTKRVMVTEDTLHNQLITREVTNQTTEDTTNKNKMFVRSSLNEWRKNTEKIFLFFIFALKNEPNKLF